ncbi:hypothetical protein KAK06_07700 [Ideonella sp. 4Y11]|uniref:Uncharacterized protein n=1 Tax=Ideonella aquatica TaxID=2824119 RepID=A0A940YT19_9BURK|nr:hypothetical protein [Ideonella aquatica]MBQ0958840.1 hypothetical protein [Ideonella aquatica]
MKKYVVVSAVACLAALLPVAAAAQPGASPAKPAAKPAAKAPVRKKAPPAPVEVPLPAATGEQNAAAAMTLFGDYGCEFNQTVKVAMNPKYDGYIDVSFGKRQWTMKPILSSTGALRLEDVKGQTLMLQIAHKSMLMDVKIGQRLVDECQHEKQLEAKRAYEAQQAQGGGATPGLLQADPPPQR